MLREHPEVAAHVALVSVEGPSERTNGVVVVLAQLADDLTPLRCENLFGLFERDDLDSLHAAAGDGPGGDGTPDERVRAVATRAPVTYRRALDSLADAVRAGGEVEYAPGYSVDERLVGDLEGYDFADVAGTLDVPVAVFHGRDDDSVPLGDSLDAVGALGVDTTLRVVAGEGHRFSRDAEARMRDALFDWLSRR